MKLKYVYSIADETPHHWGYPLPLKCPPVIVDDTLKKGCPRKPYENKNKKREENKQ